MATSGPRSSGPRGHRRPGPQLGGRRLHHPRHLVRGIGRIDNNRRVLRPTEARQGVSDRVRVERDRTPARRRRRRAPTERHVVEVVGLRASCGAGDPEVEEDRHLVVGVVPGSAPGCRVPGWRSRRSASPSAGHSRGRVGLHRIGRIGGVLHLQPDLGCRHQVTRPAPSSWSPCGERDAGEAELRQR